MKEEPPLEARCKDKFLVQTVTIRADQEVGNVASIVSLAKPSTELMLIYLIVVKY